MKTARDMIKQQINIKNINDKSLILIVIFSLLCLISKKPFTLGPRSATANGIIILLTFSQ